MSVFRLSVGMLPLSVLFPLMYCQNGRGFSVTLSMTVVRYSDWALRMNALVCFRRDLKWLIASCVLVCLARWRALALRRISRAISGVNQGGCFLVAARLRGCAFSWSQARCL